MTVLVKKKRTYISYRVSIIVITSIKDTNYPHINETKQLRLITESQSLWSSLFPLRGVLRTFGLLNVKCLLKHEYQSKEVSHVNRHSLKNAVSKIRNKAYLLTETRG